MHIVHKWGMTLASYLESVGDTYTAFAQRVGCSSQHISKIARSVEVPSGPLALRIERATAGAVTRKQLRPDLYPDEPADAA